MKSIIQTRCECFVCRHFYDAETLYPLERHHFLHGTGMRRLAEEDGLFAWVCTRHHREIHDKGKYDKDLQKIAQDAFIRRNGREAYFKRYGKFYD